jgi:hypothetical protein
VRKLVAPKATSFKRDLITIDGQVMLKGFFFFFFVFWEEERREKKRKKREER